MASNYYTQYENQINNQYNSAIGNLDKLQEADKKIAEQQYNQYRNQASANAAKNQMALREQMAAQGLFKSGDNITASTQINNQRSADITKANMEEGNYYAKLNQEKYKQMQEFEMAKQNALREALARSQEWDYRDSRDKITDDRWQKDWNYKVDRDKITDSRYQSEWDYKKQQDALNQSNWERQFAKTGSRGGGGSGGSGGGYSPNGSTKDNVWNEFSQQFNRGIPADANVWLRNNKNDIIDAVGSSEYKKMQEEASRQQAEKIRNDRRKKNTSMFQS